uniref:hypothetical protein n=1 Tax=Flavobacterium psychrophilum TaxID=96345 RepID=UPI001ABCADF1
MFSSGQLLFAAIFAISFIVIMIFAYRKDLKIHKQYYKGSLWIFCLFYTSDPADEEDSVHLGCH